MPLKYLKNGMPVAIKVFIDWFILDKLFLPFLYKKEKN
jgi:hypothetical protein